MDGEHDPRRPLHAAHLAHVWPQLRGERHESVRVSPHESIAARPECSGLLCRRQATPDGGASRLPRRRRASDRESDRSGSQRRRTPLCAPPAARRAGRVDHRPRYPPLGYLRAVEDGAGVNWRWWGSASVGAFSAAVLSKGIAMTLPISLLVLDAYPLGRARGRWRGAVVEKVPYFVVAALGATAAIFARSHWAPLTGLVDYGVGARVALAA